MSWWWSSPPPLLTNPHFIDKNWSTEKKKHKNKKMIHFQTNPPFCAGNPYQQRPVSSAPFLYRVGSVSFGRESVCERGAMGLTNFVLTVAGVSAVVLLLRSDVKQSASIFRCNVKHIRQWLEEETATSAKWAPLPSSTYLLFIISNRSLKKKKKNCTIKCEGVKF